MLSIPSRSARIGDPGDGTIMISGRHSAWPLLAGAISLWIVWTMATYLLEGYPRTLLRPDVPGLRIAYALIANILIGIVGFGWIVIRASRTGGLSPRESGFRSARRTAAGVVLGLSLGLAFFLAQLPVTTEPVVVLNAFAQVWVVSVAEVLVCWALLGTAVRLTGTAAGNRRAGWVAAWIVAAVAFGVYHFAHSPPFNTVQMVALLTVVGLGTGAFYFAVGEIYGTIVFHNFLAMKGVTDALAAGDALAAFSTLQFPLLITAAIATAVLVVTHQVIERRAVPRSGRGR